jgi:hypothetical protein
LSLDKCLKKLSPSHMCLLATPPCKLASRSGVIGSPFWQ